ncbi:tfp pilus assembly protein PilO [Pelotomaculum thermopropionicum SI]|uniref:Tfp pilus assembly protein PilO n=1 Tax=Pelotomaculum thermopropionicum (strain DSM 13744 / JCM 10971 / SI) TaxID=370438 RepID=A5D359_PELTS|nr:tfp pilus assembly protein PilO [Pelotomaculum thermopropionicum SI]
MAGKSRESKNVMPVLAGAALLVLLVFLLNVQVKAYRNARAALERERAACRQAQMMLADLKEAEKQAGLLAEKLAKYQKMMPGEPEQNTLIAELNACAAESGVNLQQISFGSRLAKEGYTEMPLELVLEGRYHDLLAFLEDIQRDGRRAVRLDSIKMSQGREEQTLVRADVAASVFYISKKKTS